MQMTRRSLLLLVPAAGAHLLGARSETLEVRLIQNRLRVFAPPIRFLTGNPLERLQNGAPVPFAVQLALSTDRFATIYQRDIERFVISYDLWEEKFSVTKLGRPRKSVSHLAQRATENWCIDEVSVPPPGLPPSQPFWVRLEVRADSPADNEEIDTTEGVSLTKLIEIFSRRSRNDPARWSVEGGPFRMADLSRTEGKR